jgi:hypothetical protein
MDTYFETVIILILCEIIILAKDIRNESFRKSNIVLFYRIAEGLTCIFVLYYDIYSEQLAIITVIIFSIIVSIKLTKIEAIYITLSPTIFFLLKAHFDINNVFLLCASILIVPSALFYCAIKPIIRVSSS